MAVWMFRVHDTRKRPLLRADVKQRVAARLPHYGLQVRSGPSTVFDLRGDRPGEWAFRIEDEIDRPQRLVNELLHEALIGQMLRVSALHVAEAVVNKRHLRAVPTPPQGIPRQRHGNSPYGMIDAPLPYTGDTR